MTIDPSVLAAVETAVMADPENVPLRIHLAGLLLESGDAADASVHCLAALRLEPDHPAAVALAAQAAEADGDATRATAYRRLERALGAPSESDDVSGSPGGPGGLDDDAGADDCRAVDDWLDRGQDWDRILREILASEGANQARPAPAPAPTRASARTPTLADVGGMEDVKRTLERSFLEPLKDRAHDRRTRGGMLLWGPPGCGKTFLAEALAVELGARFVPVRLHDVLDVWLGQSEQNLHGLFHAARRQAPCLVFIDEVDALGHKRSDLSRTPARNIVVQLLAELDGLGGINDGIFVLAATNQPWDVDPALRRPGRLDRTFCVLPPDVAARTAILEYHLRGHPLGAVDLADVARRSEGFSGADLRLVCDLAAEWAGLERADRPIGRAELLAAVADVRPSTRAWFETARNYVTFANQDGEYDDVKSYLRRHRV